MFAKGLGAGLSSPNDYVDLYTAYLDYLTRRAGAEEVRQNYQRGEKCFHKDMYSIRENFFAST